MNKLLDEIEVKIIAKDTEDLMTQLIGKLTSSVPKQQRIRDVLLMPENASINALSDEDLQDEDLDQQVWTIIPDKVKKLGLKVFTSAFYVALSKNGHLSKETAANGRKVAFEMRKMFRIYIEWPINRLSHGAIFAGETLKKNGLGGVGWEGEEESGPREYWVNKKIEDL